MIIIIKLVIIRKLKNEDRNPHALIVGMQTSSATVENSLEVLNQTRNTDSDSAFILLVLCPKDMVSN